MTSRIRLFHCLAGCAGLTLLIRLQLTGSGNEGDLYRYFLPALLGGALGVVVAALRCSLSRKEEEVHRVQNLLDRELRTNENLHKTLTDMRSSHELILDSIGEGVYRVAHDGRTTFINRAILSSTGFDEEQLLRDNQHLLLHHTHKDGSPYPQESCPVHKTCKDGKIRKVEGEVFWRKDGSSFPVDYIVTPTSEINGSYGAVVIFRDISSRVLIEEHLAASEEQFRTLFDTSTDAILIMDEQGRITNVNPATYRLFHCQDEKRLLGKSLTDFSPARQPDNLPSHETLAKVLADTLRHGSSFSEWKLEREDLKEIDVAVLLARMDLGDTVCIQANIRDISVQKKTELQLQLAKNELEDRVRERTASLQQTNKELQQEILERNITIESAKEASLASSRFLTTLSSEIQTPIQSIITICEQIPADDLPHASKLPLKSIRLCAERSLWLITDTINYSQLEARKLTLINTPFNIRSSVQETVQKFSLRCADKNIGLTCDLEPAIPLFLTGDSERLQIVLSKLLDNGLKYTDQGHVAVTVKVKQRLDERHITLSFSIRDTGTGIEAAEQGIIFDAFTQAFSKRGKTTTGTGLSLTICRKLVSLMGGRLEVESQPGKGSHFWFDIPFTVVEEQYLPEKKEEKKEDVSTPLGLAGYTLLLADDEFINRRMFSSILEKQGAMVRCTEDGNGALKLFEKENFDCILMDVQMPNCNGFEAMQAIRRLEAQQQRRQTPAIALTAHALPGYKQQCHEAGMDDFITKPVDADLLVHTISELLQTET